jgi:hypothetical protein
MDLRRSFDGPTTAIAAPEYWRCVPRFRMRVMITPPLEYVHSSFLMRTVVVNLISALGDGVRRG